MDTIPKQEFRVRDLGTRLVTLFPTRAQVVREIKNITLTPGANEITIVGLSPSVDEDSIKVEGTGSAIVSDIAVELLPNRDIFQDIYPESDDDTSASESDTEDDEAVQKDDEALTAVLERLTSLRDDQRRAKEVIASAESRLKILEAYGKMLDRKRGIDIAAGLDAYRTEREKVFQGHMDGTIRERQIIEEITNLVEEEERLVKIKLRKQRQAEKAKAKVQKVKDREAEKRRRREAEKRKEKARIRKERESFWPRYCWSVRITLDAVNLADTPSSSRRSSIASAADLVKPVPEKASSSNDLNAASYACDLSLSYVVSSAWWTPSYDLSLSTISNTALLCFDAQLTNKTSENWSNCKIVLSTSQATFAGLQDAIPTLVPWRVRLGVRGQGAKSYILDSREERAEKDGWLSQQNAWGAQKARGHLYGVDDNVGLFASKPHTFAPPAPVIAPSTEVSSTALFGAGQPLLAQPLSAFGASAAPGTTTPSSSLGLYGNVFRANQNHSPGGGALFGSSNGPQAQAAMKSRNTSMSFFKRSSVQAASVTEEEVGPTPFYTAALPDEDDGATVLERTPALSFQDTAFEETGLTTTYDLPGLKTLNTGSTASKQRVARVSFSNVTFSHTVVAKYRPVAYLKAKLRNASKLTLLKGPVGLTLDGSFMGRSTLPRCSAGDNFTLSLGVDPAIDVVYPKPDVKRSSSGIFTKEDSSVYSRSVTISNTRAAAGKPINLVVLDQVPVSEDERLRIFILNPRGMSIGGAGVPTGVQGKQGKENAGWGTATATVKKAGEVSWDVVLNAGRSVKLALEYEVAVPGGDVIIQV